VTRAQAALEALADMWAAFEKLAARAGVAEALRAARERMLRPVRLDAATIATIHAVHQRGNFEAIGVQHAKDALFVVENILGYQVPEAPVPAYAQVLTWSRETCDPKNYLFKSNGRRSPTGLVELRSFEHVTRGSDGFRQEYPILLDCLATMKKDVGNKDVGGGVGGAAKSSRYIEPPIEHRMAATENFIENVRPPRTCPLATNRTLHTLARRAQVLPLLLESGVACLGVQGRDECDKWLARLKATGTVVDLTTPTLAALANTTDQAPIRTFVPGPNALPALALVVPFKGRPYFFIPEKSSGSGAFSPKTSKEHECNVIRRVSTDNVKRFLLGLVPLRGLDESPLSTLCGPDSAAKVLEFVATLGESWQSPSSIGGAQRATRRYAYSARGLRQSACRG